MFEEDQKLVRWTCFPTNGAGPLVVVEGDPASDAGLGLRAGFPGVQIRDVGAPDLIGPVDPQPAQQIGIGLVRLCGPAGVGLLVDRQ